MDESCHSHHHVTHTNESCINMNESYTYMNESLHTYGWVMSQPSPWHTYEWVMYKYEWVIYMYERVASHIWMSHVTAITMATCRQAHKWWDIWMSHVTQMNAWGHTYAWVTSHTWISHMYIWMSHGTHMNEKSFTTPTSWFQPSTPSEETPPSKPIVSLWICIYEWVTSHIWMSHVTAITMAACRQAYRMRDLGLPMPVNTCTHKRTNTHTHTPAHTPAHTHVCSTLTSPC